MRIVTVQTVPKTGFKPDRYSNVGKNRSNTCNMPEFNQNRSGLNLTSAMFYAAG